MTVLIWAGTPWRAKSVQTTGPPTDSPAAARGWKSIRCPRRRATGPVDPGIGRPVVGVRQALTGAAASVESGATVVIAAGLA